MSDKKNNNKKNKKNKTNKKKTHNNQCTRASNSRAPIILFHKEQIKNKIGSTCQTNYELTF